MSTSVHVTPHHGVEPRDISVLHPVGLRYRHGAAGADPIRTSIGIGKRVAGESRGKRLAIGLFFKTTPISRSKHSMR